MLTECPSCLTVFRVTAAILKMGHGQVRCGKCRKQFDAIECMLDEDETALSANQMDREQSNPEQANRDRTKSDQHQESSAPPAENAGNRSDDWLDAEADSVDAATFGAEPLTEPENDRSDDAASNDEIADDETTYDEEVTMEGSRIEISGTYRRLNDDASADKIIHEHVVIDRGLPTITVGGSADRYDSDEIADAVPETVLDLSNDLSGDDGEPAAEAADHLLDDFVFPQAIEQRINSSGSGASGSGEAPAVPRRWRRAFGQSGKKHKHEEIHAELSALTQNESPRVLRNGVWATICVLLTIALIVQIVHHNRDALVRDPRFGNTVSRVYRALGLSPTPHWDLSAYKWDIYKVGLDPRTPDALRVIGSVANNAPFAQPYPLGKLSLQDRWGGSVGARAFEPYEYLPSPEAADRLMGPKQRANIEIVIADPGPDAVGYLIHACLDQDKHLTCADEFAQRQ